MKTVIPACICLIAATCSNFTMAQAIPSNWTKRESIDQFTDQVSRTYSTLAQNRGGQFSVYCAPSGSLNMAILFPSQTGMPSRNTNPEIRIDRGDVVTHTMYTSWVSGQARPDNAEEFYKMLSGKSLLAVDIFAAIRDSFNITGIDAVISDMKSLCDFK